MENKIMKNITKGTILGAVAVMGLSSVNVVQAETTDIHVTQAAERVPTDFNTVPDYAKDKIKELFSAGKINGFTDGTFRPLVKVTRAEFFAMLLNTGYFHPVKNSVEFADTMTDWQAGVMVEAYKAGLLSGSGYDANGKLYVNPGNEITRQEMASILVRAYEGQYTHRIDKSEEDEVLGRFTDASNGGDWAKTSLFTAVKLNLMNGTSNTTLSPLGKGTRTEAAILVNRLEKQMSDATTLEYNEGESLTTVLDNYIYKNTFKSLEVTPLKKIGTLNVNTPLTSIIPNISDGGNGVIGSGLLLEMELKDGTKSYSSYWVVSNLKFKGDTAIFDEEGAEPFRFIHADRTFAEITSQLKSENNLTNEDIVGFKAYHRITDSYEIEVTEDIAAFYYSEEGYIAGEMKLVKK